MEHPEKMQELYEEGMTSLADEKEMAGKTMPGSPLNRWFSYIGQKRGSIPPGISEQLWSGIERFRQRRRRIITASVSAAATVALLLAVTLPGSREAAAGMSDQEIIAALEELISLTENREAAPKVLYEDETLVISIE